MESCKLYGFELKKRKTSVLSFSLYMYKIMETFTYGMKYTGLTSPKSETRSLNKREREKKRRKKNRKENDASVCRIFIARATHLQMVSALLFSLTARAKMRTAGLKDICNGSTV